VYDVRHNHADLCVQSLWKRGADLNIKSKEGKEMFFCDIVVGNILIYLLLIILKRNHVYGGYGFAE
jgi:hypothetical protein